MMPMYNEPSPQCHLRPQGYFPLPCHGSCVRGNFPPCNAYWPFCYPPQVPYHQCCLNHHVPYDPASCFVRPPYPAGYHQPWCGNEKDVDGVRPPQMSYSSGDVVIEEHEPEFKNVLPIHSTNRSNLTTWIPNEIVSLKQPAAEVKAPDNMTVQKFVRNRWNGFFPFDEKTLKSLVENQDRKKAENGRSGELPFDFSKLKSLLRSQDVKEGEIQKTKEERGHLLQSRGVKEETGQLQYPVLLMPSQAKREDVEASGRKESSNEGRNLKSFPSNLRGNEGQQPRNVLSDMCVNEGRKLQKEANCERNVPSDVEKKNSLRSIPVEKHLQVPRHIPVNHLPKQTEPTRIIAKKTEPVGNTKREQTSSPLKASRLPPVYLRVDPLPKRKNGGSKSVNSPRTNTVHEVCSTKCEEADKEMKMFEEGLNAPVESNTKLQEGTNCEIAKPCEAKKNEVKPAKKTFTEEEAAVLIQSRFRGYDVRRWEPIQKLKEIANVCEEMEDTIKRIKTLESSSDQHIEEKQIVILGEMVMSLLLKLDSVQSLHPSIRDHRKSLAKELSDIEDKLDSMKTNGVITEKETVEEQVEITSQTSDCPVNLEHIQLAKENKIVHDTNEEERLETKVTEREVPEETMRLLEENQRFKETMEMVVKAGREQLEVISKLTGRVKRLEKELSRKKRRTQIGVRKPDRVKHATKPVSAILKDVL